ncbi:Uncharacterised protein [Mycobacteroides abscessus subsp. massiliense]|nr:Uncharacterised protein [Mycobacteroides abscessus subsp. massiliense]
MMLVSAANACPIGASIGCSIPALGSSSTITSLASPQPLPRRASRLERPTDQAGYWLIMPAVSEKIDQTTTIQVPTASGDSARRASTGCTGVRPGWSRPVKCIHAAIRMASTESPKKTVLMPKCHCGNEFDQGTPKLETYHQPLTLENDNDSTKSTMAA